MNGRTNSNNNTTGFEIEVPLDPVTDVTATAGNGQVELTWTDPLDKYAATEGEVAESPNPIVSQWDHTRVVRKENAQPTGPNDGIIVLSSDVRNQYQTTSYVDGGLINDTLYHYGLFACNTAGLFSTGTFGSATPKAGTPLSQLSEGTIIKINESSSPVEFYLAKHNYEPGLNGQGRELLVRKDVYDQRVWATTYSGAWENSDILSWLNSIYKSLLDAELQEVMGITAYQYTPADDRNTVAARSDAVFLLSLTELGKSATYANKEGTALPIASTLQIAYQGGSATTQWTRSTITGGTGNVWWLNSNGNSSSDTYANNIRGSRPAFTLPNTIMVDSGMNVVA